MVDVLIFRCSVPACRGNYDESNKVSVFGFPNDERLREKWLHAIPRKDFNITKNSKVSLKDDYLEVLLIIKEIYIKSFLDYKGGNIVVMVYNSSNLATGVQVFMLQSLFSPYKDVIHIVPIDKFDASKLFDLRKKVIMGLEEIGFKVMANTRSHIRNTQEFTSLQLENARKNLIRTSQRNSFLEEMRALENNQPLLKKSKLSRFNPFLQNGLIRRGGRVWTFCWTGLDILLDGYDIFTKLLVRYTHLSYFLSSDRNFGSYEDAK
ncbi:hypothetical protein AVEN_60866-1 [Araneus ventricosus]|uniref:Transposable element P transposase-like RNase H domain-containing protein n=1 Tax=Araneus ventricosus TaxID=182803 RepID=A0A4Y2IN34_ARAVE|nr:hypothetical protein AVEN_60866-1 [Araneus ventricosus]